MEIVEILKSSNVGLIEENIKISTLTTYRVGGLAKVLVHPNDITSLKKVVTLCQDNNVPYMIIGNGSNLLFSDKPYNGVLIKLDKLNNIEMIDEETIKVNAGYPLIKLACECAKKGLSGLEFASSIPASLGGAVYMNAGAHNSDMSKVVKEVTLLDKNCNIITLNNNELQFGYRISILKTNKEYICLDATLSLKKKESKLVEEVMNEYRTVRKHKQPQFPSAGSVFRNPKDNYAGKLIEEAGLKGYNIGGAMVSDKHANFIVNTGNATSQDIKNLIDFIHKQILDKYGIDLELEQELVNW